MALDRTVSTFAGAWSFAWPSFFAWPTEDGTEDGRHLIAWCGGDGPLRGLLTLRLSRIIIRLEMNMKLSFLTCATIVAWSFSASIAKADGHRFGYTYEPETPPKGELEFEQWVTLRAGRDRSVGQDRYNLWEFREELEYGVTDNYAVSLYINTQNESFRDPSAAQGSGRFSFDGVSIENRYLVLDPRDHPIGLTLYLEPRFSGREAEVEEKLILGQRHGDWKWAVNFTHATEWLEGLRTLEGEAELSLGMGRQLTQHWFAGLEVRDHNELPDYGRWENTAVFAGPSVSYLRKKWWVTLSVLPQVYGTNFLGVPHGSGELDLEGHERVNVRLLFGIEF